MDVETDRESRLDRVNALRAKRGKEPFTQAQLDREDELLATAASKVVSVLDIDPVEVEPA